MMEWLTEFWNSDTVTSARQYASDKREEYVASQPLQVDPLTVIHRLILLEYTPPGTRLWFNSYSVTLCTESNYQWLWRRTFGHTFDQCAFLKTPIISAARLYRPCDNAEVRNDFEMAIKGLQKLKATYQNSNKIVSLKQTINDAFDSYIRTMRESFDKNADMYKGTDDPHTAYARKYALGSTRQVRILHDLQSEAEQAALTTNEEMLRGSVKAIESFLMGRDGNMRALLKSNPPEQPEGEQNALPSVKVL